MWNLSSQQRTGFAHACKRRTEAASSLEELIAKRRKALVDERLKVPEIEQRIQEMKAQVECMTARHQVRMRKDMIRDMESLRREITIREGRMREIDFETSAARYLKRYNESVACTTSQDDGRTSKIITVPGTASETADCFASTTATRDVRRQAIVGEFLTDIGDAAPKLSVRSRDDCPFCNTGLLLNGIKSILVCTKCGYAMPYLDSTTQSMSYTDDYDFSTFSYKRQSHFDDILRLVQGKESIVIQDDIIQAVMKELYAQRVKKEDITQNKVRAVLRKLRLRRAYENVSQITTKITGVRAPRISSENEDKCRQMFIQMQPSFEKYCPKNRKNFLSYNYVLFRCFHILGLNYMLSGFSLLKGREKLLLQDEIFKKIAHDMNWPFVPVDQILADIQ